MPKSVFRMHDPTCLSYLTQISAGLNELNFHRFMYNSRDTINPMGTSDDGFEDMKHFLLLCRPFEESRGDLLADISFLLQPLGYNNLSNDALLQILLWGDKDFPDDLNKNILLLTLYVLSTELVTLIRKLLTELEVTQPP